MTLYYRHPSSATPPLWLTDWEPRLDHVGLGLCSRETAAGYAFGVGESPTFAAPLRGWATLPDAWECAAGKELDPSLLVRQLWWVDSQPSNDLQGRAWLAPIILTDTGERAFRVAYGGPDFLPVLTTDQARCLDIAKAARAALLPQFQAAENPGEVVVALEPKVVATWAAALLSITHHVPFEAFSALALVDDYLIVQVLAAATGLPLVRKE